MVAESAAESDVNTSVAPEPKASRVTPAKLSDNFNVFDIFYNDAAK